MIKSYPTSCFLGKFSTQFREVYDVWYSHGCTGSEAQSDEEGGFFSGEPLAINKKAIFETLNIPEILTDEAKYVYDLEDQVVDFSDEEFEKLFPSLNETFVNAEETEYEPTNDSHRQ